MATAFSCAADSLPLSLVIVCNYCLIGNNISIKATSTRGCCLFGIFLVGANDDISYTTFLNVKSKEIFLWKHIESEKIKDYVYLKDELAATVFTVNGIVIDGKRGLF